jgi:diaminohydroxyphosphoribosylaminopyrimidine deaminase / 5-amino-6-(5-phosphoribosylamino)uracil reductase
VRGLGMTHQPVRIVVSRRLDLPLGGILAQTAAQHPLWLCHGADADPGLIEAWSCLGARLIPCAALAGQIDATALLQALGQAGLTSVFCEGGGALAASLLAAARVDELIGMTAGVIIGAEGQPALGALGVSQLAQAPRFDLIETRRIGADVLHRWQPQV